MQGNEEFNLPMLDICSLSGIEGDMSRRKSDVDSSMGGSTRLRKEVATDQCLTHRKPQ